MTRRDRPPWLRPVGARGVIAVALVGVAFSVAPLAAKPASAAYDHIAYNQTIGDTWIPGPASRPLTQVHGYSFGSYYVCVNAVNSDDNTWAGQTMCGFNTSHAYCGCRYRVGGGHAWPGTWVLATLTQSY